MVMGPEQNLLQIIKFWIACLSISTINVHYELHHILYNALELQTIFKIYIKSVNQNEYQSSAFSVTIYPPFYLRCHEKGGYHVNIIRQMSFLFS